MTQLQFSDPRRSLLAAVQQRWSRQGNRSLFISLIRWLLNFKNIRTHVEVDSIIYFKYCYI